LWHKPTSTDDNFIITSVGQLDSNFNGDGSKNKDTSDEDKKVIPNETEVVNVFWEEIPADGIYCIDLNKFSIDNVSYFIFYL